MFCSKIHCWSVFRAMKHIILWNVSRLRILNLRVHDSTPYKVGTINNILSIVDAIWDSNLSSYKLLSFYRKLPWVFHTFYFFIEIQAFINDVAQVPKTVNTFQWMFADLDSGTSIRLMTNNQGHKCYWHSRSHPV